MDVQAFVCGREVGDALPFDESLMCKMCKRGGGERRRMLVIVIDSRPRRWLQSVLAYNERLTDFSSVNRFI